MTNVVLCPYCESKMELREFGLRAKFVFYECPNCLSRSPQTNNKYTANSMAISARKRQFKPVHSAE